MPYKKRPVRRKPYKKYAKKKPAYKRGLTVQKSPFSGMSQTQIVKMKYVEKFELDSSFGTIANYVFSANGLYDPNITGTGHQPLSFDQMMLFYTSYIVLGAKIKCTFNAQGLASGRTSHLVGIQLKDSSTSDTTSATTVIEQGRSKWKTLTSGEGSTNTVATVTSYASAKKFYGVPSLNDDIYKGSNSSNPEEQFYFHCIAGQFDEGADDGAIRVLAEIEYIVLLRDIRPLAAS